MDTPITYIKEDDADFVKNNPVTLSKNKFENISFLILLITIILAPIVFIPTPYASLDMAKTIVITFGVMISGILYFIYSFKNKSINIPKSPITLTALLILMSTLVSSILSPSISESLLGQGFELGIASTIFALFVASFLTLYMTSREKDRILYIYSSIMLSFIVVALFHLIRFFTGSDFMSFGIFGSATSTFLGKWNDLGVYSGIVVILSYISLQFLPMSKIFKLLSYILIVLSIFFLLVVNFGVVWLSLLLTFISLAMFQYFISSNKDGEKRTFFSRIPVVSVLVIAVLLVCLLKGSTLISPLAKKLNVEHAEIVLPWQLTLDVTADTLKESPLFGIGPNRFDSQYLKYKPDVINVTPFWDLEFSSGFGLIPTFFVTQGLVGGLLWILFIGLFISLGLKTLKGTRDNLSRFFVGSSFFSSLFLWIVSILYVPSHSILLLTFVLSGIFLSTVVIDKYNPSKKITSIILLVCIIVGLLWMLLYARKTIALGYFQGGINALNSNSEQSLETAEKNFKKALFFDRDDIYYQALSEINILKITSITRQINDKNQINEEIASQITKLVESAVQYTRNAIEIDPTNHYNYIAEARISEIALSLGVENFYENTRSAYINSLKFNPKNPAIYLNLARLEVSQNKMAEASQLIGGALQLKQNYIDAIFLLSQIQVSQGKIKDAITSVQVASQINPTNPLIFFQLGLLHYNNKDYTNASISFKQALKLTENYANSQYFLGLSEARLGNMEEAIVQFEKLAITNPDNEEVVLILSNLKAGRAPFSNAEPPIDNKPEQRKELPVKEKIKR